MARRHGWELPFHTFQMGSHMKTTIFEEQTTKALRNWQKAAREKRRLKKAGADIPSGNVSGETTPSQGTSPLHLLHKYKPSHTVTDTESVLYSPRSYQSDTDFSDTEGFVPTHQFNELTRMQQAPPRNQETHNIDFSFDKP